MTKADDPEQPIPEGDTWLDRGGVFRNGYRVAIVLGLIAWPLEGLVAWIVGGAAGFVLFLTLSGVLVGVLPGRWKP